MEGTTQPAPAILGRQHHSAQPLAHNGISLILNLFSPLFSSSLLSTQPQCCILAQLQLGIRYWRMLQQTSSCRARWQGHPRSYCKIPADSAWLQNPNPPVGYGFNGYQPQQYPPFPVYGPALPYYAPPNQPNGYANDMYRQIPQVYPSQYLQPAQPKNLPGNSTVGGMYHGSMGFQSHQSLPQHMPPEMNFVPQGLHRPALPPINEHDEYDDGDNDEDDEFDEHEFKNNDTDKVFFRIHQGRVPFRQWKKLISFMGYDLQPSLRDRIHNEFTARGGQITFDFHLRILDFLQIASSGRQLPPRHNLPQHPPMSHSQALQRVLNMQMQATQSHHPPTQQLQAPQNNQVLRLQQNEVQASRGQPPSLGQHVLQAPRASSQQQQIQHRMEDSNSGDGNANSNVLLMPRNTGVPSVGPLQLLSRSISGAVAATASIIGISGGPQMPPQNTLSSTVPMALLVASSSQKLPSNPSTNPAAPVSSSVVNSRGPSHIVPQSTKATLPRRSASMGNPQHPSQVLSRDNPAASMSAQVSPGAKSQQVQIWISQQTQLRRSSRIAKRERAEDHGSLDKIDEEAPNPKRVRFEPVKVVAGDSDTGGPDAASKGLVDQKSLVAQVNIKPEQLSSIDDNFWDL